MANRIKTDKIQFNVRIPRSMVEAAQLKRLKDGITWTDLFNGLLKDYLNGSKRSHNK